MDRAAGAGMLDSAGLGRGGAQAAVVFIPADVELARRKAHRCACPCLGKRDPEKAMPSMLYLCLQKSGGALE
jgi:hypothetical protein